MILKPFNELPDTAQLFIYAFPQDLDNATREVVDATLHTFCAQWESHGAPVTGRYVIFKNRFVIIAADTQGGLSGCSKDSCLRIFKALHQEHNLNALDDMLVHYEKDGAIHSVSRVTFDERCSNGDVGPDTTVYDCSLQSLGDLRSGKFETTFNDSWHAQAFTLAS